MARRLEKYANHLEEERTNDAQKLNTLKTELNNCETAYNKSKNDKTDLMST